MLRGKNVFERQDTIGQESVAMGIRRTTHTDEGAGEMGDEKRQHDHTIGQEGGSTECRVTRVEKRR